MSNETIATEIALLKRENETHDKTHLLIMEQFKEFQTENRKTQQENKEDHIQMFKLVNDLRLSFEQLPKMFDERYASKATETNQKRMAWLVISTVILALLTLVIKN